MIEYYMQRDRGDYYSHCGNTDFSTIFYYVQGVTRCTLTLAMPHSEIAKFFPIDRTMNRERYLREIERNFAERTLDLSAENWFASYEEIPMPDNFRIEADEYLDRMQSLHDVTLDILQNMCSPVLAMCILHKYREQCGRLGIPVPPDLESAYLNPGIMLVHVIPAVEQIETVVEAVEPVEEAVETVEEAEDVRATATEVKAIATECGLKVVSTKKERGEKTLVIRGPDINPYDTGISRANEKSLEEWRECFKLALKSPINLSLDIFPDIYNDHLTLICSEAKDTPELQRDDPILVDLGFTYETPYWSFEVKSIKIGETIMEELGEDFNIPKLNRRGCLEIINNIEEGKYRYLFPKTDVTDFMTSKNRKAIEGTLKIYPLVVRETVYLVVDSGTHPDVNLSEYGFLEEQPHYRFIARNRAGHKNPAGIKRIWRNLVESETVNINNQDEAEQVIREVLQVNL